MVKDKWYTAADTKYLVGKVNVGRTSKLHDIKKN